MVVACGNTILQLCSEHQEVLKERHRNSLCPSNVYILFLELLYFSFTQLEYQRQELLKERQHFHMEQMKAAEFRARQIAAQQLNLDPNTKSGPIPLAPVADSTGSVPRNPIGGQPAVKVAAGPSGERIVGNVAQPAQMLSTPASSMSSVSHENSMCAY